MSSNDRGPLDELYRLRYDLTFDLYRRKARALEVDAQFRKGNQLVYYAYKLFGSDLMGSIAFALDPYWQFAKPDSVLASNSLFSTVFPRQVVSVNRTRKPLCIWPYKTFRSNEKAHAVNSSNFMEFSGGGWHLHATQVTLDSVSDFSSSTTGQEAVYGFIKDTTDLTRRSHSPKSQHNSRGQAFKTKKSRKVKSQGEFELFIPKIVSLNGTYSCRDHTIIHQLSAVGSGHDWTRSDLIVDHFGGFVTPCASVTQADCNTFAVNEKNNALAVFAKNKDQMMEHAVPSRRYFNLAYQIGELKDLPEALKGTLQIWLAIERLVGKQGFVRLISSSRYWSNDILRKLVLHSNDLGLGLTLDQTLSDAFLNFKFGWQSMVQALTQLVSKPAFIANEINRLIAQNGKDTSFSTSFSYVEPVTSFPNVTIRKFSKTNLPTWNSSSSQAIREVKLRLVVNCGLNFPSADIPRLRHDLWVTKLGTDLTPGDFLDLVPWTWLFDWFFGAGNYLHLMDAVNSDKALINYGFMTYKSVTHVTAQLNSFINSNDQTLVIPPNGQPNFVKTNWVNQAATMTLKYQLRKSLANLAGIKSYLGTGLNPTQGGIIGALMSKYLK